MTLFLSLVVGALVYWSGSQFLGVCLGLGLFLGLFVRYWQSPARWLKVTPYAIEPKKVRITPERLYLETASVKSELPWTYYISWDETPDHFMLDMNEYGFCSLLPKSAFSEEQQALFRQRAAAQLPKYPRQAALTLPCSLHFRRVVPLNPAQVLDLSSLGA